MKLNPLVSLAPWAFAFSLSALAISCTPQKIDDGGVAVPDAGEEGNDAGELGSDAGELGSDAGLSEECRDATAGTFDGECPLDARVGGFVVDNQVDFTVVSGGISDAVLPQSVLTETIREGDCALLSRPLLFCDPPCAAGETCDGEQCIDFPAALDKGRVNISGLDTCVSMEAFAPGNNYFFNGLGRPGMEPGDLVELYSNDFSLHGLGVAEIVPAEGTWVLQEGSAMPIQWTASESGGAEVTVSVSIDQHGTSPLRLDCAFEDDGDAEIPASLIDALINAGVSGFPTGKIRRRTADQVTLAEGCVDFVTASTRVKDVRVAGFTPCNRDEECPEPQTCDVPNQICVD